MNRVKRTANKRFIAHLNPPTGVNRFSGVDANGKQIPAKSSLREVAFLRERPINYSGTNTQTKVSGSMRGDAWTQENRRRRSVGLPQKRVLPFGIGTFDPISREISKTLPDGTVEISKV